MSELLVVDRVRKSFQSLHAVDGASLAVPAGRLVGLIGPNGSGKSTLFNVIAGHQAADSGRIAFDGHDLTRLGPDQIFRLGLVRSYQNPALFFRMTVLDNGLLPFRDQRGERPGRAPWHRTWLAQETALAAEAARVLDPLQLGGRLHALASELSGGQMKLLELGRSLNGQPRMLLLDEPTAGVAPALARSIFEHIAALRQAHGLSFLIIEHRLEVLFDFVDEVYVMSAGQVIAHGTPADIAANREVREIYFGD